MSTRATYRIYDNYNHLDVYFYAYDSNPSGAALFFQNMLDYIETEKEKYWRHPYTEAFFRANKDVHFTKSHNTRSIITISANQMVMDISFRHLKLIMTGNDSRKKLHSGLKATQTRDLLNYMALVRNSLKAVLGILSSFMEKKSRN